MNNTNNNFKQNNYIKLSQNKAETDRGVSSNEIKPSSSLDAVGNSCRDSIKKAFDVLILERKERPFDWYKDILVSIDKSDASRIRRGLIIPPLWLRIKIAAHFKVDTSVIWPSNKSADEVLK